MRRPARRLPDQDRVGASGSTAPTRRGLKSGIGDISIERATGHAEITAGVGRSARSRARRQRGDQELQRRHWVGVAGGDLRVKAANGKIAVDAGACRLVAKSSNGDVRLGQAVRGSVVLETRLGDVEVGIREGTAAWLDVRAAAGSVHNELEAAEAPGPAAETVEVRARTTAGSVVITRIGARSDARPKEHQPA